MPLRYYADIDYALMEKAQSFGDLFLIAKRVLNRMSHPVIQVCGPISTGGLGSRDANIEVFNRVISTLVGIGLNVFNQIPFETHMARIYRATWCESEGYCMPILTEFYQPLFDLEIIGYAAFIPRWRTSTGTIWENGQFTKREIPILHLPPNWEAMSHQQLCRLFPDRFRCLTV